MISFLGGQVFFIVFFAFRFGTLENVGMDIFDLIVARHSVRQYLPKPIEAEKRVAIDEEIKKLNEESGLRIQTFYDEPKCFDSFMAHYGKFTNVSSYFSLVGKKDKDLDRLAGYYGEKLVLFCQGLGLNTCWVALTHGKSKAVIGKNEKESIIISVGYGAIQGLPHKSKKIEDMCPFYADLSPEEQKGVQAVLLAPTAMNQQKVLFKRQDGELVLSVSGVCGDINAGITQCHYELVSGHKIKLV